jgi:hypothetical protein
MDLEGINIFILKDQKYKRKCEKKGNVELAKENRSPTGPLPPFIHPFYSFLPFPLGEAQLKKRIIDR